MIKINKIYNENCIETLKRIPDEFIDCCITSPPYWGLRDYGEEDQIGLEKTPQEYVNSMIIIFNEVKRVLKKGGTLWLNLGDSYAGSWGNSGAREGKQREKKPRGWAARHGKIIQIGPRVVTK